MSILNLFNNRRPNSRGDTIVEILVVLAILGFAFSISYATANKSLIMARNAQEHSAALQYLDSQVELIRADSGDSTLYNTANNPFCMTKTTDPATNVTVLNHVPAVPPPPTGPVPACTVPVTANGIDYNMTISYAPTPGPGPGVNQDVFTLGIYWDGVSTLGVQHEHMVYKVHNLQ